MIRPRNVLGAIAAALVALPFVAAPAAHAANPNVDFTSPPQADSPSEVWYTGETHDISWTVAHNAGTETDGEVDLYHFDPNYVVGIDGLSAPKLIAKNVDVQSKGVRWTIPTTGVTDDDSVVMSFSSVTRAADNRTSGVFQIKQSRIANVKLVDDITKPSPVVETTAAAGASYGVTWDRLGITGDTVNIDLVATTTTNGVAKDGTAVSLAKGVANDGAEKVTIADKTAVDTSSTTHKIVVTPTSTTAKALKGTGATFKVVARSITGVTPDTDASIAAGDPVHITWTSTGGLGNIKIEAIPSAPKAKTIVVDAGTADDGSYTWYPPASTVGGTFALKLTGTTATTITATSAGKVTVGSPLIVKVDTVAPASVTQGAPVTVSWEFDATSDATEASDNRAPVDISILKTDTKKTLLSTIGTNIVGKADPTTHVLSYTFPTLPITKLPVGSYTVKVAVTGADPKDANIANYSSTSPLAVVAPTALTVSSPQADASFEAGAVVEVNWGVSTDSQIPVNIDLVDSKNKVTSLAKAISNADTKTKVTIPGTTVAGTYSIKVSSVDKFGTPAAVLAQSISIAVTDPVLATVVAPDQVLGSPGTISWTYGDDSQLPVKIEVWKSPLDSKVKTPAVTISKSAPTSAAAAGSATWTPDLAKFPVGDYLVKITAVGPAASSASTLTSDVFTVAKPTLTVDSTPIASGVDIGETLTLHWAFNVPVNDTVSLSLVSTVSGKEKVTALATKVTTLANGTGSFVWVVDGTKTPAGTGYKVRVTDTTLNTIGADSTSSFAIVAPPK